MDLDSILAIFPSTFPLSAASRIHTRRCVWKRI